MTGLITRRLGRTNRDVTTLGLGGQASLQWPTKDIDPVAIVEKACRLGVTYLDTSNIYGPSQKYYGQAFKRLGLSPCASNYDPNARSRMFVASKTHIRTARLPVGEHFRSNFSDGMTDHFGVISSVDDVRRSLSLMFGDGKGNYPEDAYLDSVQLHDLNTLDEIDMLYEGLEDPSPERPKMGALAALLDLREGSNRTGCNPKKERLIKHIGISAHWNSAALMYAIRRDHRRIIDTLLVTINPSDSNQMPHRHNAISAAARADMGIIGMKVFADAAYYHKEIRFSNKPDDVYHLIGSDELPSDDLIAYALSTEGISTIIIGIGHIDDDPEKCQLERNLSATQISEPLSADEMKRIEKRVADAGKDKSNTYFQRKPIGLSAPMNVGVEDDSAMPIMNHHAVRISWDTAYAGNDPIVCYQVFCDDELLGSIVHTPQITETKFYYTHIFNKKQNRTSGHYRVRAMDAKGNYTDSRSFAIAFN